MKAEAIIIDDPQRQKPIKRYFYALITLLAWVIWSALWLPLVTLVAWSFGIHTSYVELVLREHGRGAQDLWIVAAIMIVCTLIEISWSLYNQYHYGQLRRRLERPLVDSSDIAIALHVQQATALKMRDARNMTLIFLDDNSVTDQTDIDPRPSDQQPELPQVA